jgi:hypothetical protein
MAKAAKARPDPVPEVEDVTPVEGDDVARVLPWCASTATGLCLAGSYGGDDAQTLQPRKRLSPTELMTRRGSSTSEKKDRVSPEVETSLDQATLKTSSNAIEQMRSALCSVRPAEATDVLCTVMSEHMSYPTTTEGDKKKLLTTVLSNTGRLTPPGQALCTEPEASSRGEAAEGRQEPGGPGESPVSPHADYMIALEALARRVISKPPGEQAKDVKKELRSILKAAKTSQPSTREGRWLFVHLVNLALDSTGLRIRLNDGRRAKLRLNPGASGEGFIQFATPRGSAGGLDSETFLLVSKKSRSTKTS